MCAHSSLWEVAAVGELNALDRDLEQLTEFRGRHRVEQFVECLTAATKAHAEGSSEKRNIAFGSIRIRNVGRTSYVMVVPRRRASRSSTAKEICSGRRIAMGIRLRWFFCIGADIDQSVSHPMTVAYHHQRMHLPLDPLRSTISKTESQLEWPIRVRAKRSDCC